MARKPSASPRPSLAPGLTYANPADPLEMGQRPGHLIWRVQQRAWRLFADAAGGLDVTPVQASVLLVVANQPGIDQKTLAGIIAMDRATTGNVIGRLETRGLLKRVTSPADHRARILFLTKPGALLNRKLGVVTRKARRLLVQDLTAQEQKELIRLMRKILRL